jgi:hypothetical protein
MVEETGSKSILRITRKVVFAGSGKVATVSIPSTLKRIFDLRAGDMLEFVVDLQDPVSIMMMVHKKVGGQGKAG